MNMNITDYENPFNQSKSEIYEYIDTCRLSFCPYDTSIYSNIGIALLGLLIEDFKNEPYENLIKHYIFDELDLKYTYKNVPDSLVDNLPTGHLKGLPVARRYIDGMKAAGALNSNAYDLINFISYQLGHKTTEISNSINKTHQKYHDIYLTGHETMCLSWFYRDRFGSNFYNHGGTVRGYKTFTGFDMEKKIGVVVLTNSFCFINDIGWHILNNDLHIKTWEQIKDYNY